MKYGTLYSFWGNEWKCDYEQVAKKVAQIGFDILEVSADHIFHMPENELKKLNTIAKEYGLILTTNSGPSKENDLASEDEGIRKQGFAYLSTIIRKMELIDSKSLVGAIYSFWPCDFIKTNKEEAWEKSITGMQELGKIASSQGVEIALEVLNRNETYILTDCKEALEYCKQVNESSVKILLDTYHMNIEEDNLPDAFRLAGDMLAHVHVGENNRKLPGMNNSINWALVGQALRDINYNKAVVMEPFLLKGGQVGHDVRVWRDLSNNADEKQMDEYIKTSLQFLKNNFEGR